MIRIEIVTMAVTITTKDDDDSSQHNNHESEKVYKKTTQHKTRQHCTIQHTTPLTTHRSFPPILPLSGYTYMVLIFEI